MVRMVLPDIQKLEQRGYLDRALHVIEISEPDDELTLIKCRILHFLNNHREANSIISSLITKINTFEDLYVKLGIYAVKLEIQFSTDDINTTKIYLMEADKLCNYILNNEENTNNLWLGLYYHIKGKILQKQNQDPKAVDLYHSALAIFKNIKNIREEANAIHSIANLHSDRFEWDRALKQYNVSLGLRTSIENDYDIANSLIQIGVIHGRKNNYDKALQSFHEAKDIYSTLGTSWELVRINANIAMIHRLNGALDDAEDLTREALDLAIILEYKEIIPKLLKNLAAILIDLGSNEKMQEAEEVCFNALVAITETGNLRDRAAILNNLGVIKKKRGDVNSALEYYQQSLDLEEQLEATNIKVIGPMHHNIGSIYLNKGEIQKAKEHIEISLEIRRQIEDEKNPSSQLGKDLQFMGMILIETGPVEEAISHLLEAYEICLKNKNIILQAEVLFNLILSYDKIDDKEKINHYHKKLNKLGKKSKNKIVLTQVKLAEAISLQRNRIGDIAAANDLLSEVISGELVEFEFTVFAMLKLCEILIIEYRLIMEAGTTEFSTNRMLYNSKGDQNSVANAKEEILGEIKDTLIFLFEKAQEHDSHSLLIDLLLIQSKMAVIEYNLQDAKTYLDHATDIAENMGMNSYKIKISKLNQNIEKMLSRFSSLQLNSVQMDEIKRKEMESYLDDVAVAVTDVSNNHTLLEKNGDMKMKASLNLTKLLLMDKYLPVDMRDYVKFLVLSIDEIGILQETLLILERIELKKRPVYANELELGELIHEQFSHIQSRVEEKHIDLQFTISPVDEILFQKDKSIPIYSDKKLLEIIFKNLLINAAKFTIVDGYIKINLAEKPSYWIVYIQNHSKVIPADKIESLFDKYTQFEHDPSTRKEGVGLGLAFVKEAVDLLNGRVYLHSPIPSSDKKIKFGVQVMLFIPKIHGKEVDYDSIEER